MDGPREPCLFRTDASFRMLSVAANPDQTLIYLQYSPDYLETTQPPPDSILDILNLQGQTVQSYRLANRRHDFAPD